MKRGILTIVLSTAICFLLISQTATAEKAELKLDFSAYVDSYIATDNDKSVSPLDPNDRSTKQRQFAVVNNLKDEFGLNVAMISANISYGSLIRSTFSLHTGTLPENSHGMLGPNVQEAYVGMQLFENFWIDAGSFLTHIGGEALLPKDNWLSSHSMVTYYEPFFHTGLKFSYELENFTGSVQILNGNGIFEDNNVNKSLGAYFSYNINEKMSVSYAGIFGNENDAPAPATMHMYHNVCIEYHPTDNLGIKGQFDYASQEDGALDDNGELTAAAFMGFSAQSRYAFTPKFATTARFSFLDDGDDIYGGAAEGISGIGATLGVEYKPHENAYIRLEGRMLQFDEGDNLQGNVFFDGDEMTNSRLEFLLNFGVWFN